ncbi:hypothetical protein TCAL_09448 [Tigriopus californicus]|uniref:DOMON domain-containing protein n=1 Tax=Tigriopus californicus TaxID=6832 RepID=A0A553PTQ5_TIGCA|nr:protein Skeletor, isoforms B/C-like [Tigriopus californicus]XP_059097720.1 protein Skeletor, isoforms B/C-like [Tigriopus californicus]XP_059097721.1 protein Skeletor, isoforms B/C-like [Tigriopus californicus]TRY81057.1 hypothetical protein TCAL_09448 [Tigriopus californicus]|eukprot:TCALIF_09448-PA protein Name:"Similar to Skeletor Protein Skeletor, isoforms B/C (Drosophila melanogaster)" AED:0.06 eAED:0.06 QI:264/1/1/1/0.87/0.77/9/151/659
MRPQSHILASVVLVLSAYQIKANDYYGNLIGSFTNRFHGITGDVYTVDSRTLFIKGFSYDGQGPDAYFYAGESGVPSEDGYIIANEKGTEDVLSSYRTKNIVLTLPGGKTVKDIKWLSVWCRAFGVNFGELVFPDRVPYPRPQKISPFDGIHDVKSESIVVVDAQTFLIPSFSYDGTAPDAHFWVGKGTRPGPEGNYIADENGSNEPLKKYGKKTLVVVLPSDITVFDIDWLSIWCVAFFVDFGSIRIPKDLNVPPSLRMLGIEPQTKLNCEILDPSQGFEVRWAIAGRSIVTQLVAKLDKNEYMAFGLSGDPQRIKMIGGDVTVAWMDHNTGQGFAEDYYLDAKSQCAGGRGACPDKNIPRGKNDVRLLNSAIINDYTMLTYRQPLNGDGRFDSSILTNQSQSVIWAIGPINSKGETSYHSKRIRDELAFDFGRIPQWNCPIAGKPDTGGGRVNRPTPAPARGTKDPWFIPAIQCHEPEDSVYFAQIGPTGGEQGYQAITGHVGWGIAWYVNGLLIPEIYVVRGKTYTFVIEGGLDPSQPAGYHPFYITDDPEGGYEFMTPEQRKKVTVFAGIEQSRLGPKPVATGRLCEWKEDPSEPADGFTSFGGYQRSLTLQCEEGQPGIIQWTPDRDTPDEVYYQCYTHRYLGWKIHVVDQCDQ